MHQKPKSVMMNIFNQIDIFAREVKSDAQILDNDIQTTSFSDSIIISYKINSINQLPFIITSLRDLLIYFIEQGVLIRGAITRGDLFHLNDRVFGSALIDAYELESIIAVYPRIIIGRDVLWYENVDEEFQEVVYESIMSNVSVDLDGWHYVDYIGKKTVPYFTTFLQYLVYCEDILIFISGNLNSTLKIKQKYAWLNRKIHQSLSEIQNKSELMKKEKQTLLRAQNICKNNARILYSKQVLKEGID